MKKIIKYIIILLFLCVILFLVYNYKDVILKKIYPVKYVDVVNKYSKEYEVDKYLVFACIKAESNFKEKVSSRKGAKGLMQLMDSTAEEVAESIGITLQGDDILNPEININLGTKYLATLLKKYSSIELALAAYNAGSGKVDNWIKEGTLNEDGSNWQNIPYGETKKYVRKILIDYDIYKKIYQEEG